MLRFIRSADAVWLTLADYPLRTFAVGAGLGILVGALFIGSLGPLRCSDSWTYAVPGQQGGCPVGSFLAERAESESAPAILVVCRCVTRSSPDGRGGNRG